MNTEYISMRAAQLDRHKRVFTRWINMQLAKANPPAEVNDLFIDLKDGQVLLTLVEVLLGIEVSRQKENRNRITQLSNVQQAMRHFGKNKVNTLGIIASEIVAGGQRATLSLVWSIIVRFQISEAIQPDPRDYGVDKKLMKWCQERLKEYKGKVRVVNFTTSWSDGLGFNALLHSLSPSVFDFDQISACDPATRLKHAFNVATSVYGVPKVVDPEDIVQEKPDKNLITLFLSYIYLLERREIVTMVTKESEPEVMTKTYHVTTLYETTNQGNGVTRETTIQYSGSTSDPDVNDGVFYDVLTRKEGGGNEKVLRMQGLPEGMHIQQSQFPPSGHNKLYHRLRNLRRLLELKVQLQEIQEPKEAVEPSSTPQRSEVKTYKITTISKTTKTNNGKAATDVKEMQIFDDVTKAALQGKVQEGVPIKVWLPHEPDVEKEITVVYKQDQSPSSDQDKNPLATKLEPHAETEEVKPNTITSQSQPSPTDREDSYSDGKESNYSRHRLDESSLMDYLKKRLDHADQRLFDLERSLINSDKDTMDLKSTKKALDQHKELAVELTSAESEIHDILKEGNGLINKKSFDKPNEDYFTNRLNDTENRVKRLVDTTEKEHQRLLDLYRILLKQHLERMNDWLVRAESRMTLDDEIEPSYEEVQKQMINHKKFQEELANYSMATMILDVDLDDPAIDETARDWVKVLSERWAAVWNWAEEWKEKLNQALIDWEKFREEEQTLLTWLSSKEQTLDTIRQTDITDENQVKANLSLFEALEREMETQRNRLASLHETGEQLIRDADYHNSVAKNIREQTEDFDRCWAEINDTVKRRKSMLEDGNTKLKQMDNLMEELRSWMDDTEKFLSSLAEEKEPARENIIEEKIELKCEERDRNQLKFDEITKLEMELTGNIDKTSNRDMKNVSKPFIKRWNDVSNELNKYRNEDFPYTKADDCSFIKFLKRAFVKN